MRLGIFGGTFDPPHVGHLILADEARYQLNLDRVLWVLTPAPPHKTEQIISPWMDRLAMLEAAIEHDPNFLVSRVDIDRPAPHYTSVTLSLLRQDYPKDELVFLMGGDSLEDLPAWHQPGEIVTICNELGVMRRPGQVINMAELERIIPGILSKVIFLRVPMVEISSSLVRQRVSDGGVYRYYLPDRVYKMIAERGFYNPMVSE
jgi:nicotinate-nucleotide adenylyltransferase